MAGNLYGGDLFFNLQNPATGQPSGWGKKVYSGSFKLNTAGELKKNLSRGRDDYNQLIGSVSIPGAASLTFGLRDLDLQAFRMLWLGTVSALTQASGSVTDEAVNVKTGGRIKTAKRDISAVVVTSSPAGTTYVAGTDYVVTNARLGFIDIVDGSSLATAIAGAGNAGLNLLVDYSHAAVTGSQIQGGTQPSIVGEIIFDGKNLESLKPVDIYIPRAVITPSDGVDMLAQDFLEAAFSADLVITPPYTAPFIANYPQG